MLLLLLLPLACGDDDGTIQDGDSGATQSVDDGTTGSTTATGSTTSTGSPTATSSSTSSSTDPTSGSSGPETTAADSSTGPGEPVVCTEELTCSPGEVCVLPCCGGPAPACFPLPAGGDCGTGTLDEGGVSCCQNDPDPETCVQMDWCIPGPCVADPPYCAPMDTLTCNGTDCTTEGCYGDLVSGVLQCSCK